MISGSENIIRTISEERYQGKAFLLLLLIVCLFKIPVILTSDIQPWDEGMYAVRVLSIHINRDFFDPGTYYDSKLFVPDRFKLLKKYHGYELYED